MKIRNEAGQIIEVKAVICDICGRDISYGETLMMGLTDTNIVVFCCKSCGEEETTCGNC